MVYYIKYTYMLRPHSARICLFWVAARRFSKKRYRKKMVIRQSEMTVFREKYQIGRNEF